MPDKRNDVSFGFDPRPFLNGLSQVQKGMGDLGKRVGAVAGQMTRRLLAVGGAVFGLKKLLGTIGQNIPEIGQAFKIAGQIVTRNLFWPLRQQLMPYLMKVLDWVRTHRATFVKWGAAVASVFKVVVSGVKQFYDILKRIVFDIAPSFKKVFGSGTTDFFNLIALKLSFVIQLAAELVKKIADWIAPIAKELMPAVGEFVKALAGVAWATIKGFFDGLASMSPAITKAFSSLSDAFRNLGKALGGSEKTFENIGKVLGQLAGGAVAFGLKVLADAINVLAAAFALLSGNLKEAENLFNKLNVVQWANEQARSFENWVNNLIGVKQLNEKVVDAWGRQTDQVIYYVQDMESAFAKASRAIGFGVRPMSQYESDVSLQKAGKSIMQAHDVVITKRGDIVKLDPSDNIVARKNMGGGAGFNVSVQLSVTEGNARAAGMSFASGLADQLRNAVLAEQVAGGY